MDVGIVKKLDRLNREFYQTFSDSFSTSRYHTQPGVQRVLEMVPHKGTVLDLGCGNGNILRDLVSINFKGSYHGLDFSADLLQHARALYEDLPGTAAFQACFSLMNLLTPDWNQSVKKMKWDVICSFAAFHHIPGSHHRLNLFRDISKLMLPSTLFMFSVWQPQNSPRLRKRFLPWDVIGLSSSDIEDGDVLLDWKAEQSSAKRTGYRYVHIFTETELIEIADGVGCEILQSFYSDGKEGNLGLYQIWKRIQH